MVTSSENTGCHDKFAVFENNGQVA